jgi:UDP-N-acetylglucosamine 2-epimerase (non-hydrolysing)
MKKVVTVIGIRPDIIRLSLIIKELNEHFNNVVVDTGQHWDYNLNKVMYEQLDLNEPHYRLDGKESTQVKQIGKIAAQFEEVLDKELPDFVIILGDNNSSLTAALVTANKNIPIVHIESGNRSFNWNMPEEKNRTVVDHLADLHFCYTEEHRENLIREGIDPRSTWVVGNPIIDVLEKFSFKIKTPQYKERPYILATLHRHENVTDHVVLGNITDELMWLGDEFDCEVLLVEMPKLKQNMAEAGFCYEDNVIPIAPQPYLDFLGLMAHALFIVSDSGTVPEEAYAMKTPCIQVRDKTERVELMENSASILAKKDLVEAAKFLIKNETYDGGIYKSGTAERIIKILLGNAIGAWGKRS